MAVSAKRAENVYARMRVAEFVAHMSWVEVRKYMRSRRQGPTPNRGICHKAVRARSAVTLTSEGAL